MTHSDLPETGDKAISRRSKPIKKIWLIILPTLLVITTLALLYSMRISYQKKLDDALTSLRLMQTEQVTLQTKLVTLEEKVTELKALQAPLEQSLLFLNHTREEVILSDIEQVLDMTMQQLNLVGNVPSAIAALQGIELRLSSLTKPRFANLRLAVKRDLLALKAIRNTDIVGEAQKLDQVMAEIDHLPLLSSQHIEPTPTSLATHKNEPSDHTDTWFARWQSILQNIQAESVRLLSIRRIDDPVALLISPEQAWFVRESLKLRLLNARIALLIRNQINFQSDLSKSQEMLKRYFDANASSTKRIQMTLQEIKNNTSNLMLPALTSMVALQQVKTY